MPHLTAARVAGLALPSVVIVGLLVYWRTGKQQLPDGPVPGLGNFAATVQMLPPVREGRLRFAVLGDPEEGLGIFRTLMEQARAEGAAFVLITGDVADHATEGGFASFLETYRSLGAKALPTFTAVGNHDIEPTALFERLLGPRQL